MARPRPDQRPRVPDGDPRTVPTLRLQDQSTPRTVPPGTVVSVNEAPAGSETMENVPITASFLQANAPETGIPARARPSERRHLRLRTVAHPRQRREPRLRSRPPRPGRLHRRCE